MAKKREPINQTYLSGKCDGQHMFGGKLRECSIRGGCKLPGCPALVKN